MTTVDTPAMKHIGILSHSFEGATLCYRTTCLEGVRRLGPHLHPEITMTGIAMHFMMDAYERGDQQTVRRLFEQDIDKLAAARADFFVCPDNTAHIALELPGDDFAIPCLHIGEVVAEQALRDQRRKVGILGTNWTMTGPVYPQRLDAAVSTGRFPKRRTANSSMTSFSTSCASANSRIARATATSGSSASWLIRVVTRSPSSAPKSRSSSASTFRRFRFRFDPPACGCGDRSRDWRTRLSEVARRTFMRLNYLELFLGILLSASALEGKPIMPASQDEALVLNAANDFFDAMRSRDQMRLERILLPAGSLFYETRNSDGSWKLKHLSNAKWLADYAKSTSRIDEQPSRSKVKVFGPIAIISQQYVFSVDGQVRHCGTNILQLVKSEQAWRIANITWTEEKAGAGPSVTSTLPNRNDVIAAAARIAAMVERTPLIESEVAGQRLWLKCECLQPAARSS